MWPVPNHGSIWPSLVILLVTAVCAVLAFRTERAGSPPALPARYGWPLVAALLGTSAYGLVSWVLIPDLHNPSPAGPGYLISGPDLEPGSLFVVGLFCAGLLAAALLPVAAPERRRGLSLLAVLVGEGLALLHWSTNWQLRTVENLWVSVLFVALLAAGAGAGATRLAAGRPAQLAGPAAAREARWALLLPSVVVMAGNLLGLDLWAPAAPGLGIAGAVTGCLVGLAVLLALVAASARWPRAAGDLAALGLIAIGGYDIARGGFGNELVHIDRNGNPPGPAPVPPLLIAQHATVVGAVFGALLVALGIWLLPQTVLPDVRRMLGRAPDPALTERVQVLTETRAEVVSSAAAELRRIERDLHDGAQGRLVAIGINLRTAQDLIRSEPEEAVALVVEARESSATALEELRALVRGIYPPVLADRGLAEAVRALALDLPLPCETAIELSGRLDAPVESACYFAVAELVTNAVRHARANRLRIALARRGDTLRIEVEDDGVGGADPAQGSGLTGIERRLAAFDGILTLSSPHGGPTLVVLEVPCG